MLFWPSLAVCFLLLCGAALLVWLCAIDLKLRILPDELTGALAVLGLAFAWAVFPHAGPWYTGPLGGLAGGGGLYLIRAVANRAYGFETMGLGDIKLLGAGGLWLGAQGILLAVCVGAFAGVLHGLGAWIYARAVEKQPVSFRKMTIPAGPGFCVGLAVVTAWICRDLPLFAH